jgi:4-hydroxybenzoate polyprenyltransferase
VEGDKQAGYKTMPITSGQYFSKILIILLVMLTAVALGWIVLMNYLMDDYVSAAYLVLFVIAPLLYIMVKVAPAGTRTEYGKLSQLTKLVMVTGVLSILVFTLYAKYLMNQAVEEETTIPPPEEWIIRPAQ